MFETVLCRRTAIATPFLLFLGLLSAHPLAAQLGIETTKITDFMATRGVVEQAERSPDGQTVVYRASQETSDVVELYAVPTAGGVAVKLSQAMTAGGDVLDFVISPDSQWVAFLADAVSDQKNELYLAPIGGGTVTQVNGAMVPGGDVSDFRFSPDSAHVVYSATQRHFRIEELFAHAIATSAVAMLSPVLGVDGEIHEFTVSPDSSRVVFTLGDPGGRDLYSAPIGGGGAIQLGEPPSDPDLVSQFEITPDSLEVIFFRDNFSTEEALRSVSVTGGATTLLSPVGMDVESNFLLTSDASTAIFEGDTDSASFEIFALDLATGTATNLSGSSQFANEFFLSPDESQVAFLGRSQAGGPFEYDGLAIAPIGGGSVTELADTPLAFEQLHFTPDGSRIVYHHFDNGSSIGTGLLFSVPSDGSAAPVDLAPDVGDRGVRQLAFDATTTHVLYRSDTAPGDVSEVFSVPVAGGAPTRVNDPLPTGAEVEGAFFDGDTVLYWADQDELGVVELYRVASGGGGSTRLSAPMLGTGGVIRQFLPTPNEERVVFIADQTVYGRFELWSTSLSEGGPAVRLSEEPFAVSQVERFALDPTGTTVVFQASRDVEDVFGLWATPVEGGPVIRLDDPADGTVGGAQITADGQYVLYRADDGMDRIFRAAIGGGDVRLLVETTNSPRWAVSPDGQHVVYIEENRLFSIPVDSGPAVTLSPPGLTVASVSSHFRITPDSSRVVFLAFSEANQRSELYVLPIEGGIATPLSTGEAPCSNNLRSEQSFYLTPDSTRVLMLCGNPTFPDLYITPLAGGPLLRLLDTSELGRFGTLRISPDSSYVVVRHDGASGPYRLTGTPTTGGEVEIFLTVGSTNQHESMGFFAIAPDSSAVVFLADGNAGSQSDLFTAPLGPGDTVKLNPEGNVTAFAFAPDSSRIFYLATPLFFFSPPPKAELVSVPVGGGPVRTYHPSVPDGRYARAFQVLGDSKSVLYAGDIDHEGTVDLYYGEDVLLFADGFESGDTSSWSNTVP